MDERKRTLVGDGTIPLADVFQMISMSQKDGTLIVSDQDSRKCIFFGKDGVRLLASGKRRAPKLGDRLVRAGRITTDQLKAILDEQKKSGRKFGEIAVARGLVTAEELQGLLRTQVEDELCDCFLWKYTLFEFYEGPPPDELMSGDQPITQVTLNVNGLLMEALRRRDEWLLIQPQVPAGTATLTWTDAGRMGLETLRTDPACAQVVSAIDGINTVEDVVGGTLLSAFDVYRVLADLLQKGYLRELSAAEAMAAGETLSGQGRFDRALALLQRAVQQAPTDPAAHQALGRALLAAQKPAEALDQLRLAGEQWLEAGRADAGLAVLQEALPIDAQAPAPRLALVRCLLQLKRDDEACAQAEEILKLLAAQPRWEIQTALCEAVLQARPADLQFRCALAAACAANGDRDRARAELRLAVRHITPQTPNRGRWFGRMLEILPDFTEARAALDNLMMSGAEKRRRLVRKIVLLSLPVLLLAAAGVLFLREQGIKETYAAAIEQARRLRTEGKLEEARGVLQAAKTGGGRTFLHGGLIDIEIATVEGEITARDRREQEKLGKAYGELEQRLKEAIALAADGRGRIEEALPIAREVAERAARLPPNKFKTQADTLSQGLQAQIAQAQQLRAAAAQLEQEGRYAEACQTVADLVSKYPGSVPAQGCTFPYAVQSVPPGATILLNGQATPQRTPAVIRLPLKGAASLGLQRAGFESFQTEIADPMAGALRPVPELKKSYAWRRATGGVVEASPVVAAGGLVVAGSSDGHVYAVAPADNKLVWEFKDTGAGGEIVAPLRAAGDAVYFSSNDKNVYALAAADGRLLWKYPTGAPLRTPPAPDPSGPAVYVAGADRKLHAVDRRTGTALWTPPLDLDDAPGSPSAFPGAVVVGTASGTVVAIDPATRKPRWQFKAGGAVASAPILAAGNLVIVSAADSKLYALRAADGTLAWDYQAGMAVAGCAAAGDLVLAGSRDKLLYALAAQDGKLRWTFPRSGGSPIQSVPLVHNGTVYAGTEDGTLHAVKLQDGQRLWGFKTDGPVRSTPVPLGNRLFFGSNDRHLYALDVD